MGCRRGGLCGLLILLVVGCGSEQGGAADGGATTVPENTPARCQDGVDNDGDGVTDCQDPDCSVLTFCLDAGVGDGPRGDGAAPDGPEDLGPVDGPDGPPSLDGATADAAPVSCTAHCDCPQGQFCYYGACFDDPKMQVYCCTDASGAPKAGCQPGRWCFNPDGTKGTCAESTTHACTDACDCGPAHCCKKAAGASTGHCVKDTNDPWDPGGTAVGSLGTCKQGTDATYCCTDPLCHAGKHAYSLSGGLFRCADSAAGVTRPVCGGEPCFGTACNCDPGESCVDTAAAPVVAGKTCGMLSGGACLSNAVAEAVYGIGPSELLPCCAKGCSTGQKCEVGWRTDGQYAYARVVGVCGGTCGNKTCDPGETAAGCPGDCGQSCGDGWCLPEEVGSCAADCAGGQQCDETWGKQAICGDGICQGGAHTCDWTEAESCRTCPQDCQACDWQVVHGHGGSLAVAMSFSSAWGSSSTDVFVVGGPGAIAHFDGHSWTPMFSGTTDGLGGAWGFSPTDVWAVAGSGNLVHYDGLGWTSITTGNTHSFGDLWGSSPTDLFAVGGWGAWHYDGTSWTSMTGGSGHAVWGTSSTDVIAVGSSVWHYDGTGWTQMKANNNSALRDVWGESPTSYFAVGPQGLILHYDGVKWGPMSSGTNTDLRAVWGSSSTDVFAAGRYCPIMHYDGKSWTAMTSITNYWIEGIWGTSSTDVFAVGPDGLVLHYDGTSWTSMTGERKEWVWDVWGSSPSDVFTVGQHSEILHYDGTEWSPMPSGTTAYRLDGIWGSSSTDVYAVGSQDTMLHFDGSVWSPVNHSISGSFDGLWGSSATDIYVVGGINVGFANAIAHYDGASWTLIKHGLTDNSLESVWGSSATDIFAVGSGGTILHFDGASWSAMSSGTIIPLNRVWGSSSTNVFVVLDSFFVNGGWLLHYDGASWSSMSTGTAYPLNDVWGTSSTNVFAVGLEGSIVHHDGTAWSSVRADFREPGAPTCRRFYGVGGAGPSAVYAVGEDALIARECPAGSCPSP